MQILVYWEFCAITINIVELKKETYPELKKETFPVAINVPADCDRY
jgi:hypothetical protein